MRAGELRHQMTLRAPVGVESEAADVDVDTNVAMKIDELPLAFQSREALGQGGLRTQTIYTLTGRYRTDVKASYIWIESCCTQRTFQILAIIPSPRRDSLAMTCVTNG